MGFTSPDDRLVRELAYAYFFDWKADDPRFMFLIPDPGSLGKRFDDSVRSFEERGADQPPQNRVSLHRRLARGG